MKDPDLGWRERYRAEGTEEAGTAPAAAEEASTPVA